MVNSIGKYHHPLSPQSIGTLVILRRSKIFRGLGADSIISNANRWHPRDARAHTRETHARPQAFHIQLVGYNYTRLTPTPIGLQ